MKENNNQNIDNLANEANETMIENKYLEKYMNGDEEARNILIERNLRLVAHICKKYKEGETREN